MRHMAAAIAQLVEHVIRNDGVTGSNPVCGTSGSDQSYPNIREDPWLRIDADNPQLRTPAEFFRPSAALMRRS
jgi:hypothetical protein